MSDNITLSDDLLHGIYNVIVQHDPSVEQNMMVALQYLAAVMGYMSAGYPGSDAERNDLIDQLGSFAKHVAEQEAAHEHGHDHDHSHDHGQQPQQAAPEMPKGKSHATDNPAVGIWKPE